MPIQSPRDFLAATIPAEVRGNPAHRENIERHLTNLEPAAILTDSERIRHMYDRGAAQDANAARADMFEGIHNGCRFFSNLAQETGNQNLGNAAQLVSSGTQIYSAYTALSSATNMAGCINPIATAALAAYTIFSTFRRKKRRGDPFAEAIMQNLAFISNQINAMQADMFRGFERSFEYHRITLELISDGFRSIIQGQDALYQHTTNMHVIIANELRIISWYVHALGDTLVAGQESISLQPFANLLASADDIQSGVITEDTNHHIQQTAISLKQWAIHPNGKASNPIYTGVKFFSYTPRHPSELYAIINKVINPLNPYNILEWQGMLAHIVKNQLNSEAASDINVDALFNPDLWQEATSRYLRMRQTYPALVTDPDNRIITSIIAAADNQIAWEREKRHSIALYNTVFGLYEKGIRQIQQVLRNGMSQKVQALQIDIAMPVDQLIAQFANIMPMNPNCPGETSINYFSPKYIQMLKSGELNSGSLVKHRIKHALEAGDQSTRNQFGYTALTKPGINTTYPLPIHHHEFSLAERLGLITITAHQTIKYRQPTEPPAASLASYISDDIYTLKAVINNTETILEINEFKSNTQTNTKTFVQRLSVPNIDDTLAQVRTLIDNFLKEQKKSIIMRLFSDAQLNITFKDEALATVDASIRLLSALMSDWPTNMRELICTHLYHTTDIVRYLTDSATHAQPWQSLVDNILKPQFQSFKDSVIYNTRYEDAYFNGGYLTEIRELHRVACEIRDNPPVAPVVEPTSVTPTPAELVPALIETINQQSEQIQQQSHQIIEQSQQIATLSAQMNQMQQMFAAMMHMQQNRNGSSSTSRMHVVAAPSAVTAPGVSIPTTTPSTSSSTMTLN